MKSSQFASQEKYGDGRQLKTCLAHLTTTCLQIFNLYFFGISIKSLSVRHRCKFFHDFLLSNGRKLLRFRDNLDCVEKITLYIILTSEDFD